jgi:hypothetical protein
MMVPRCRLRSAAEIFRSAEFVRRQQIHFVSALLNTQRHVEAERLGSLKIDTGFVSASLTIIVGRRYDLQMRC